MGNQTNRYRLFALLDELSDEISVLEFVSSVQLLPPPPPSPSSGWMSERHRSTSNDDTAIIHGELRSRLIPAYLITLVNSAGGGRTRAPAKLIEICPIETRPNCPLPPSFSFSFSPSPVSAPSSPFVSSSVHLFIRRGGILVFRGYYFSCL